MQIKHRAQCVVYIWFYCPWWRHQWKHSPRYWTFVVTCEFPSQRPVTRIFYVFFDLRLNNHEAGDLRCHRAHYDVIVMLRNVNLSPFLPLLPLFCMYRVVCSIVSWLNVLWWHPTDSHLLLLEWDTRKIVSGIKFKFTAYFPICNIRVFWNKKFTKP